MRKQKVWAVAAMAAVVVVSVSASAEAFCHRYRSVPVWYGAYYPSCGPCGACIVPYVASGYYGGFGYCRIGCGGYGGCGYGGCGYGGCGYGGCGYGHGCGKWHGCCKLGSRWAAHKAWKRAMRGSSCFGGCFSGCFNGCGSCFDGCGMGCGGCGDGCGSGCTSGCANCTTDGDSGEVIYDGPAAGDDSPPMPVDQSASVRRPLVLLAGLRNQQADGSADFERGVENFRRGSLTEAASQFEAASAAEPDNAMYHYYRALTLHDLYGAEAGVEARQMAVEAELRQPIKNWGRRMERVQGRSRLWIEKARRDAGLVR